MTRYWLLGGTGKVGTKVANLLSRVSDEIITVSRRKSRNEHSRHHVQADLSEPTTRLDFGPQDRVINLSEATGTQIVKSAVETGAIFIETAATPTYVLGNRNTVRELDGPGHLLDCVGVAPGLTNLMARTLMRDQPNTEKLSIAVELGLGDHAGPAATKWFFESLGARYSARTNGRWTDTRTADFTRKVPFVENRPARIALNFPFVEQSILAQEFEENTDTVSSLLALSPPWITRVLWIALRLGFGGFLSRQAATLTKLALVGPSFGETTTRIVLSGFDRHARPTGLLRLETGAQSRATAVTIAAVAQATPPEAPSRISTIADWLTLDAAVDALGLEFPQTRLSGTLGSSLDPNREFLLPTTGIAE